MSTLHLHVDFFPQLTPALFILKRLDCLELFKQRLTKLVSIHRQVPSATLLGTGE
jgi:hypothetical protein